MNEKIIKKKGSIKALHSDVTISNNLQFIYFSIHNWAGSEIEKGNKEYRINRLKLLFGIDGNWLEQGVKK